MTDDELLAQFADTTLAELPHVDHVRLVYLYAREAGTDAAALRIRAGLIAFTAARGAAAHFHETRTWAWAILIGRATEASAAGSFAGFIADHPEFLRRDLLDDFYSPDVLLSDEARTSILAPDRAPIA